MEGRGEGYGGSEGFRGMGGRGTSGMMKAGLGRRRQHADLEQMCLHLMGVVWGKKENK